MFLDGRGLVAVHVAWQLGPLYAGELGRSILIIMISVTFVGVLVVAIIIVA